MYVCMYVSIQLNGSYPVEWEGGGVEMVPLHTSSLNSNHNHPPQLLAHSLAERKIRQKQQLYSSMSSNPLKSQSKHDSITSNNNHNNNNNNNRSFNSKRRSNSSGTNNTASDASFSFEDNTGENNTSQESAPIPDHTEGEEEDGEEEKAAAILRPGQTAYIQVSPISPKSDSKNPSRNSYIDDTEDEGLHYSRQQEEV